MQDGLFTLGMQLLQIDVSSINEVLCKLFHFHSWGSGVVAAYHVVAMAIDRVIVIKAPFWHRNHSSPKHVRMLSWAIVVMSYTGIRHFVTAFAEIWLIIRYSASFIFYCMSGRAYRLAFVSAIKTKMGSKTEKPRVTTEIATADK
ncbi:uncharacterized protein LOC142334835 [Convolutriloba macropyga]|uniref:uncharacterized protein LOC142334835 n=1 Tax=Convolutriloba macropyga TaxID=536237 RepID=UPI003F522C34